MRKGQSPVKMMAMPAYSPRRVGVGIGVYIPFVEGYYQEALPILRYQLASLRASTPLPFDLLVLDNGSCAAVQSQLRTWYDQGWIDWLTLSPHNLGRNGAINYVLGSMPNELIVFSDCDVLFRPGWLEASLKIMDTFPKAGLVAAQPVFFDPIGGVGTAHRILEEDDRFEISDYVPEEVDFEEYCRGIGAPAEQVERLRKARFRKARHRDSGVEAVLWGTHMTFMMPQHLAFKVIPLPAETSLGPEEARHLDYRVDQAGYLHLSTTESYVMHMGNSLDPKMLEEVTKLGEPQRMGTRPSHRPDALRQRLVGGLYWLSRKPIVRGVFRRVYNLLFDVYAEERRQ